ncbi:MAG: ABC-F family ATP-binding cassette domain-containing protein [Paludibacteraceae bacterium]|nr:ABC-F family ATP-binding cassette domain-containing protein [Paludibacteraceae bacterium]OQC34393.1 MAG: putative ABC transporter ATP-binding protein [Bacteroidetes bacterium ADurb.Bin057]HHT61728.1 ABC-F family ATP-binding cassette domain-containing protein [Bacteroidales bacterium]HPO47494.1 ABC-F family ATP-binding cassette domain-containing protein [Paludibacteraceae bacterium]HRR58529.1 ABC-F family ATP-binding cassette domain-containing protein [Paludibacteraceae bacterium]
MVYLQVENLTKSFGERALFQGISFGIDQSQRIALVAQNGAGKTTLLNILVGNEVPDDGTITFRKDLRVGFLSQEPKSPIGVTVLEACFLSDNDVVKTIAEYERLLALHEKDNERYADDFQAVLTDMDRLNAWDYETRIKQILGKLAIHDFDKPVEQLSGGQQKRLALANVLITEPDLLLLDEPTNHLDLEMVEWLEDFLNQSKMTLLMVTHDRYFLDRVCSDILEIDQQQLFHYKGNYTYYLEQREMRIDNFNAETARAKNLYRKELDWMRRQPQARGTKAQSRIDAFYEIEERAKRRIEEKQLSLGVKSSYLGSKIFEAQYVSKAFDGQVILNNFYYNFSRYEKLGITGKNGTGKSVFLKMLLGKIPPDSGRFDIGETVVFAYYSQSGLNFDDSMKVIDAVRAIAEEVDLGGGRKMTASQFLTHFLFPPQKQYDFIANLSGGEKRRLYLCTVLMRNPNFLVLDEPTNDLDIASLNVLEDYLITFKGCVIVVSHDRFFMDKVVDHLLVFKGNGDIQNFPGNYTDYRQWAQLKEAEESEKKLKTQNPTNNQALKSERKSDNDKRKLTFKKKRELEQLELEIAELEAEQKTLETVFSSGETMDGEQLDAATKRFAEITTLLDEKTVRWLFLSDMDN